MALIIYVYIVLIGGLVLWEFNKRVIHNIIEPIESSTSVKETEEISIIDLDNLTDLALIDKINDLISDANTVLENSINPTQGVKLETIDIDNMLIESFSSMDPIQTSLYYSEIMENRPKIIETKINEIIDNFKNEFSEKIEPISVKYILDTQDKIKAMAGKTNEIIRGYNVYKEILYKDAQAEAEDLKIDAAMDEAEADAEAKAYANISEDLFDT
jgi:hypothetical protein